MRKILFGLVIGVVIFSTAGLLFAQDGGSTGLKGKVVFLSQRDGTNIWLYDLETGDLTQLTNRPHTDWAPALSPDGERIAWHAKDPDSNNWDIWVMNVDGSDMVNLTNTGEALDMLPEWSPDGEQIVFVSNRDNVAGDNRDIYIMNADGSDVQRVAGGPYHDIEPIWSPDGAYIAYASDVGGDNYDLMLVELETGIETPLVTTPARDTAPAWSPDGTQIAFSSDRDGTRDLWIVDLASGDEELLFAGDNDAFDTSPDWSANGQWIVFYSNMDDEESYNIYLLPTDGSGDPIRLTEHEAWDVTPSLYMPVEDAD